MSGKTSNDSKRKWNAKAYDRIELTVHKGQKEIIKQAAVSSGMSVNAWINEAISEKLSDSVPSDDKPS